jgi:hypothetical protein
MPFPTDAVSIGETAYQLCVDFGLPCARTYSERLMFAPRWAFDLLNMFNRAGYPPDNIKHRPNGTDDVVAMRRLVKKILREALYDLTEVHAAIRLGGPGAALQLGGGS